MAFSSFDQLKHILSNLTKLCPYTYHHREDHEQNHPRNFASFPTVPVHICAESVKENLPCMSFSNFLERKEIEEDIIIKGSSYCSCIVCLNQIEKCHEVRVPINCSHVFHRECLDAWIDQGQLTCPLCRSKLCPTQDRDQEDPWRLERMVYLFGDDCLFG